MTFESPGRGTGDAEGEQTGRSFESGEVDPWSRRRGGCCVHQGKLTGLFADLDDRLFPPTPITVNVDNDPGCPLVFTAPAPDAQRALDTDHGREIDKRRAGGIDGDTSRVEL